LHRHHERGEIELALRDASEFVTDDLQATRQHALEGLEMVEPLRRLEDLIS